MKNLIAIDCETTLLAPGSIAPKLICLSAATFDPDAGEICAILYGNAQLDEIEEFLDDVLGDPDVLLVFHNAGFDLTVIANAFPQLIPAIFAKLEAGGATDTGVREKLLNLSTHGKLEHLKAPDGSTLKLQYRLMDLVLNYTGVDRTDAKQGDDIWRLNYEALDGYHVDDYPQEARKYAMQDAIDTLEAHDLQAERVRNEIGPGSVKTQEFQTAVMFALRLMTCWGLLIDQNKVDEVDEMCNHELTPEKLSLLIENKILTPAQPAMPYVNGAKDINGDPKMKAPTKPKIKKKLLQEWVLRSSLTANQKIKLTDKAKKLFKVSYIAADTEGLKPEHCSTDKEVVRNLAPVDPLIKQYQHRQKLQKLVTTYLPHLRGAKTIHPEFDVLKETGRTSSYASSLYPSTNIQQEDPRTRPCFIARPGYVFAGVDYQAIELASLAQKCYTLFGYSVHRDKINAGVDLHAYLGSRIAYKKHKVFLKTCKVRNVTEPDDVYELFIALEKTDPDFYDRWRNLAKPVGLGFPGGMGAETFVTMARNSYRVIITLEEAKELKEIWLETYPEMVDYIQWIKEECVDPNNVTIDEETGKPQKLYCYLSSLGMYRAGANYCAAANGAALQTNTSEGAKAAVFNTARACYDETMASLLYGSRPVIFNHDEIIVEIPDDDKKHELAWAIAHIMIDSMQRVLPDVTIRAEPLLMRRWYKKAKPVLDNQGRLTEWQPKEQNNDTQKEEAEAEEAAA